MTAHASNDHVVQRQESVNVIQAVAGTLSAIAIVGFQSSILPFFQPLLASDRLFWPAIYYGYWFLTVCVTIAVLVTDSAVRRQSLPILIVCTLTAALTFLHPLDWVAKNLAVAMMLLTCVTVLGLGSRPLLLVRLSATVTALSAVICGLDVLFADGLTNTAGRAAGLAINPNDAANAILVGAAATYWAVPRRLQVPFLLLNGIAIFFTLSRSTLLAATIIVSGVGVLSLWQTIRNGGRPRLSRAFSGRVIVFALGLLIWGVVPLFTNDRFVVAATQSFGELRKVINAMEEATGSVRKTAQTLFVQREPAVAVGSDTQSAPVDAKIRAQIDAISKVSENEGEKSSVSARALFMWRAFITYESGPFFGSGLAAAHEIVPHNTFLLFAVAFGHLGWLVPFALIGLTLYRVRNADQLALGLATTAVLMVSHDILFPSLIVSIAVGIVGNISRQNAAEVRYHSLAAVRRVVVVASILFVVACGVVIAKTADYFTMRFGGEENAIQQIAGSVFAVKIPRPVFAGILRVPNVASQDSAGRNLFLLEDGKVLSDAQASDKEAMVLQGGKYVVWRRRTLLFSTSDNSDPRFNGRSYEIQAPVSIHPLILLVIGAVLIWCMAIVRGWGLLEVKE